jgi:hypothetical protein
MNLKKSQGILKENKFNTREGTLLKNQINLLFDNSPFRDIYPYCNYA